MWQHIYIPNKMVLNVFFFFLTVLALLFSSNPNEPTLSVADLLIIREN